MSRGGYSGTPPPCQPPLSFKTVPGRNRTQKWNEAQTYKYDGDDWGGFDAYDEYGAPEEGPDDRYGAAPPGIARQQSFEAGSERRQFSAPAYPSPAERRGSPAMSAGSHHSDADRRRYHDPSQPMPHPHIRQTHSPPSTIARKSSEGSIDSASSPKSPDKPLPFIRPSDIYKRMAEQKEKERLSQESSRPSMDSLQREDNISGQRPLSTVQERPGSSDASTVLSQPALSTAQPASTYEQVGLTPISNQLRGVVQDAFTRPTVNSPAEDMSRSNTDSSSAISPIMPHTTSASQAPRDQNPVSPIIEEPSHSHSRNISAETMVPSRYAASIVPVEPPRSFSPAVPSPNNSPARTPDVASIDTKRLSGSMKAQMAETSPAVPNPPEADDIPTTGRPRRGTDYSIREADLAREASIAAHAQAEQADIGKAEQQMQSDFLSDHNRAEPPPLQREWSFEASPDLGDSGFKEILSVPTMPAPERNNSFQPHLPGEWISAAPTPALEERPPVLAAPPLQSTVADSRSASQSPARNIDFSPTSRDKPDDTLAVKAISAVKDAGAALGAAFVSTAGSNHQDRDFAAPSRPIEDPTSQQRGPAGEIYSRQPPFNRQISSTVSESNASLISDRPPTPPAKDQSAPTITKTAYTSSSPYGAQTIAEDNDDANSISSGASSAAGFESDRLRRDIVKSLDMSNDSAARSAHLQDPTVTTLTDTTPRGPSSTSRPGLLDQRFSWETQQDPPPVTEVAPIAVVGELPGDEDRQSFERPDTGEALHVVNAPRNELVSPLMSPITEVDTPVQPTESRPFESLVVPGSAPLDREQLSPSPASADGSTHIPSYYAAVNDAALDEADRKTSSPRPAEESRHSQRSSVDVHEPKRQSGRIPPFREILALKTPPERIQAYRDTRHTFAQMDTGLQDWLTNVFATHPEHEGIRTAQGMPYTETNFADAARGHKYNTSLLKMKQRSSGQEPSEKKLFPNASRNSDVPPALPPKDISEVSRQMQAKGKDIMKSAGVLGGKAQAGAKGLFAKGKSKFARGDKVE